MEQYIDKQLSLLTNPDANAGPGSLKKNVKQYLIYLNNNSDTAKELLTEYITTNPALQMKNFSSVFAEINKQGSVEFELESIIINDDSDFADESNASFTVKGGGNKENQKKSRKRRKEIQKKKRKRSKGNQTKISKMSKKKSKKKKQSKKSTRRKCFKNASKKKV